jgi:hypothetical protein
MANKPGIKTTSFVSNTAGVRGDQTITSNATLASVGLICAVGANATKHIRAWIPITVGATGGVRAQVVVPAAGTAFNATITLNNTVAPSTTIAAQTASAAFTNALANAGTHWLLIEATIVNGATAGNIDVQLAQNTSDVLSLTVLRGGYMDVTEY